MKYRIIRNMIAKNDCWLLQKKKRLLGYTGWKTIDSTTNREVRRKWALDYLIQ